MLPTQFGDFIEHVNNDFEVVSSCNICEKFSNHPSSHQNQFLNHLSAVISPNKVNGILRTADTASEKMTGKRAYNFDDSEFPPLHSPLVKKVTIKRANSCSKVASISRDLAKENCSSNQGLAFAPPSIQGVTEDQLTYHFKSNLPLKDLINNIDQVLKDMRDESVKRTSAFTQQYVFHNTLDYTWKLFFCQFAEHCEIKIQILEFAEMTNGEYMYAVNFDLVEGNESLFEIIYGEMKRSILSYQNRLEKEITTNLQSKCCLMSPSDSCVRSRSVSVSRSQLRSLSCSDPCHELLENLTASVHYLKSKGLVDDLDFYLDPINIEQVNNWISQLYLYNSPLEQLEAMKNLYQICENSSSKNKNILLLQQLHLVEVLLTLFTATSITSLNEEGFSQLAPLTIQILLSFAEDKKSVKAMSSDENFVFFVTSMKASQAHKNQSLKWLKFVNDCHSLYDRIGSMIGAKGYESENSNEDFFTTSLSQLKCKCS